MNDEFRRRDGIPEPHGEEMEPAADINPRSAKPYWSVGIENVPQDPPQAMPNVSTTTKVVLVICGVLVWALIIFGIREALQATGLLPG